MLFLVALAFGSTKTVFASEESLDVTEGWEILEYNSSQPNILVEDVVKQGVYIAATNQKVILSQFANIGKAKLVAKKEILLKKDHVYSLNLVYAMQYNAGSGFIDFNGERIEDDSNYQDQNFQRVIKPTEDMTYTIEIGFDVKQNSNGYWKVGYDVNEVGVEAVQSKIITRSFDNEGILIQSSERSNAIGEAYSVSPEVIDGYSLDESQLPQNQTGIFTETDQTIDYIYQEILPSATAVIVNYVDGKGHTIHEPQSISGSIGESYDASQKAYQLGIEGYYLDPTQLPENMVGTISNQEQVVTYVYLKEGVVLGNILIKYLDQTGKEIHPSETITNKIGSVYDVSTELYKIKIENYTLDESKLPENTTGFFTENIQTIEYVYTKNTGEETEGTENEQELEGTGEAEDVKNNSDSDKETSEKEETKQVHGLLPRTSESQSMIIWLVGLLFTFTSVRLFYLRKKISEPTD